MYLVVCQVIVSHAPTGIISYIKAHRLISTSCLGYLAHVYDMIVDAPIVELVSVIYEFLDVFPTDFPGLCAERDVNFGIEVELGIKPISIPLYQMPPADLKELSTQLQGLSLGVYLVEYFSLGSPHFVHEK